MLILRVWEQSASPAPTRIVSGTGRYAGIRGYGKYQLSLEFIAGRSNGKCSPASVAQFPGGL